jgi:hypothetical protein
VQQPFGTVDSMSGVLTTGHNPFFNSAQFHPFPP